MATFFKDTFTDTAGTLLSAHTPDTGTYNSGASTNLANGVITASGELQLNGNYIPGTTAVVTQQPAAAGVSGTIIFNVVGGFRQYTIQARGNFSGNTYYQFSFVTNPGSQSGSISVVSSGSSTTLATVNLTLNSGSNTIVWTITNNLSGDVIHTVLCNGAQVYQGNDPGNVITGNGNVSYNLQDPFGVHSDFLSQVLFADASAALQPGTANNITATNTQVILTGSAATGGSGSYTYAWQRSTSWNFTPGSGLRLSSLGSNQNFNDTTATAGQLYWYCQEANDGTGSVYSNQVAGRLWKAPLSLLFIGDSITNGYSPGPTPSGTFPGTQAALALAGMFGEQIVNAVNQGVNGTQTGDWLSGSANLIAAKTAGAAASPACTTAVITLGTNDCINGVSAATLVSNLSNTIGDLLANGYTHVILNLPTGIFPGASPPSSSTAYALLLTYLSPIAALANNTTIFLGDANSWAQVLENQDLRGFDGVHFPASTYDYPMGPNWAGGIYKALNPGGGGGGLLYAKICGC